MAHTYEELANRTIEQLREIAQGLDHEAVKGFTQMNKEHLLPAICKALGLDARVHHHVVGLDKSGIKAQIKKLKEQRAKALEAGDGKQLRTVLRQIHHLKRRIRAATV